MTSKNKIRIELYPPAKINSHGARCNLDCLWCHNDLMPDIASPDNSTLKQVDDILRQAQNLAGIYGQFLPVQISAAGEPTLLPLSGLTRLLSGLVKLGYTDIGMTSNGTTGSPSFYSALRKAGLLELNISLNTLRPERYAYYTAKKTGERLHGRVVRSIDFALQAGLKTSVNCIYSGLNADELDDMIEFTATRTGLKWKFFDLLGATTGVAYRPVSDVIGHLVENGYTLTERSEAEYAYYLIPVGLGEVKIKLSREVNLCPNDKCHVRSDCNEGCRASIRVSRHGIQPCGIRNDNIIPVEELANRNMVVAKLKSGGKY